jgi:hypothetical protein
MSRFDADFAACGLPSLMDQFGQSAVYLPIDGPEVTLTKAVISPERPEQVERHGIVVNVRKCEATISRDPDAAYGGVASVTERATVTFGGETWPITRIMGKTDAYTIVALERPEGVEHAHEGFRGHS